MATRQNGRRPPRPRPSKPTKFMPEDNDIIIPVMGPTGAGKSAFINSIAGKEVARVGHDLKSCTAELLPVVIDSSRSAELLQGVIDSSQSASPNGRRLVLMDTPGFGDTYVDDVEILRLISYWLESMYGEGKTKLAGIIYLHDISLPRMLGATRKNLDIFQKLCGDGALRNVVICTTKWSDVHKEEGDKRTGQLSDVYWKEMIAHGSAVHKFRDSQESASEVVKLIIKENQEKMEALRIQEELVDAHKLIPDTEAGRQLRYSLDQLLKSLKQASRRDPSRREELDAQIAVIRQQIKEMRIPVSVRVLGVLDLGVDKILNIFTLTNRISPSAPGFKKLLGKSQVDESTLTNHTQPSTAPPVGVRLGADVKDLILLLGETGTVNATVLKHLAAKRTAFGNAEVHCWSVERGDRPQLVVEAPGFDSPGGLPFVFQNVRTWLSNSCREDMQIVIIHLQHSLGSVGPPPSETSHSTRTMELVKQSTLASNTLFATFTGGEQTTEGTGEATSQFEYSFDGSVAWEACDASNLLDIALEKPIGLDLLLSGLHAIIESANTEVLILVMGETGCGKSTFINSAAGEIVIKVEENLTSSSTIQDVRCSHPTSKENITLVEMPGFDNARKSDSAILMDTAKRLKKRFNGAKFGGILYLHKKGRRGRMPLNVLSNNVIQQSLLHVVTNHEPPSGSGGASVQGDVEFPNITGVAVLEQKRSAWVIIDQVLHQVEPMKLPISLFHPELRNIAQAAGGTRQGVWDWLLSTILGL